MTQSHIFNVEIAKNYGVNEAIFLTHISFWIQKNSANNKHYHDGRFWTYNKLSAFSDILPYWTPRQVRTIIDNCVAQGLLLKGNYNQVKYDQTSWYALTDLGLQALGIPICQNSQMGKTEKSNQNDESVRPIPDIKPDIKPDKHKSLCASGDARDRFDDFWDLYPSKKNKSRSKQIWEKKKCDQFYDKIKNDLEFRISNDQQWKNPQFIPHPSTYLQNERWNDEIILSKDSSSKKENGAQRTQRMCMN